MEIPYYPGCTLKRKATALDISTQEAFMALGVQLKEIPSWTCCGAVYPLTSRKISGLAAPIRILREAKIMGSDVMVTGCSFCFNVLKRANRDFTNDPLTKKRISAYIADDVRVDPETGEKRKEWPEFGGESDVKVLHLLEYLRDRIGFDSISSNMKRPLQGLEIAPYYGCALLRPAKEIGLDDPENPVIMASLFSSLVANPIDFAFKNECCASFLSVSSPEVASRASHVILESARSEGAKALAVTCPLCFYNLEQRQSEVAQQYLDFKEMPVFYFTELLALAMGVEPRKAVGLNEHSVDVRPLLKSVGLLEEKLGVE